VAVQSPSLSRRGLGEVLLEIRLLNPHFTKGDLNGYSNKHNQGREPRISYGTLDKEQNLFIPALKKKLILTSSY